VGEASEGHLPQQDPRLRAAMEGLQLVDPGHELLFCSSSAGDRTRRSRGGPQDPAAGRGSGGSSVASGENGVGTVGEGGDGGARARPWPRAAGHGCGGGSQELAQRRAKRGADVRDKGRKEGWGAPLPSSTLPPGEGEAPSARASHWRSAPAPPPPRRLPPSPLHVHLAASTPRRWSSAAAAADTPWSRALCMRGPPLESRPATPPSSAAWCCWKKRRRGGR
jgi:hypothetical protein